MKKFLYLLPAAFLLLSLAGYGLVQGEEVDYKASYEKQMKENTSTMETINGVVAWLKEHHYEKYPNAKDAVDDALDSLNNAEVAKKKAEDFAAKANWKQASGWSTQYWQYLVKVATEGLRAKKMVEDAEAEAAPAEK